MAEIVKVDGAISRYSGTLLTRTISLAVDQMTVTAESAGEFSLPAAAADHPVDVLDETAGEFQLLMLRASAEVYVRLFDGYGPQIKVRDLFLWINQDSPEMDDPNLYITNPDQVNPVTVEFVVLA